MVGAVGTYRAAAHRRVASSRRRVAGRVGHNAATATGDREPAGQRPDKPQPRPDTNPHSQRDTTSGSPAALAPVDDERARRYADWLFDFGGTDLTAASLDDTPATLTRFARHYGSADDGLVATLTLTHGRPVRVALRRAAIKVRTGKKALRRHDYRHARHAFADAIQTLHHAAQLLKSDLRVIEAATGRQVTRHGFVTDSESTRSATVTRWIDGDTVDTDRGQVRLIGINASELTTQCRPAKAAKTAAAELAPPGHRVRLINPRTVRDIDRHGRLLRYVDTGPATGDTAARVDVGYSLLLNNLAEARYDSRDGYQWHPRETSYRSVSTRRPADAGCRGTYGTRAFYTTHTLARTQGTAEYWHRRLTHDLLPHPYTSATRHLQQHIATVQRADQRAARAKRRTVTTQPPTPSRPVVHPGAFCSPYGALGVTNRGTLMRCQVASDGRNRWSSA